jgi:hypothetical protein
MLICISISHDADRVSEADARVYPIASTEETPIREYIPRIDALHDDLPRAHQVQFQWSERTRSFRENFAIGYQI